LNRTRWVACSKKGASFLIGLSVVNHCESVANRLGTPHIHFPPIICTRDLSSLWKTERHAFVHGEKLNTNMIDFCMSVCALVNAMIGRLCGGLDVSSVFPLLSFQSRCYEVHLMVTSPSQSVSQPATKSFVLRRWCPLYGIHSSNTTPAPGVGRHFGSNCWSS